MKNVLKQENNNFQKQWFVAVLEEPSLPLSSKVLAAALRELWWGELGTKNNPTKRTLHPTYEQLRKATGMSNKGISSGIKALVSEGFLEVEAGRTQGVASRYFPVRWDKAVERIANDYLTPLGSNLTLSGTYLTPPESVSRYK